VRAAALNFCGVCCINDSDHLEQVLDHLLAVLESRFCST
jgi:hypothetical protein